MNASGVLPRAGAWAEIDLSAVERNVEWLCRTVAPAALWAVVKADGYGHGAVAVASAALRAGASGLAVALVGEAEQLRRAGILAPVLLLSEPPVEEVEAAVALHLHVGAYSPERIDQFGHAAARARRVVDVHLKLDTGMHRVGARPEEAVALARRITDHRHLRLAGVWTHCAVADDPADPFTAEQLRRFDAALAGLRRSGLAVPLVHTANSAGAIAHPAARRDLVRCGIALYGIAPSPSLAPVTADLEPAMRLVSTVSYVKVVGAGEAVSYGLRHRLTEDRLIATVPIGYADGVPRRLYETGGEVLIGGRRHPIAGVVTMDQLMVDCGHPATAPAVEVGDEVVLLGAQGAERVRPEEWAARLGTIGYEVVCAIGARVPRRYVRTDGRPPAVAGLGGEGA